MAWTLDDALQECARNTYNTRSMIRTTSGYAGKGLEYARRFLSGINYAINKVSREKVGVPVTETLTLDDSGRFSLADLASPCLRLKSITLDSYQILYTTDPTETVTAEEGAGQAVSVRYEALPTELTLNDLDGALPLDNRYVDPRVMCQYANYQFLSEEGTDYDSSRAQVWLGLFTDSFENIVPAISLPRKVRYNG